MSDRKQHTYTVHGDGRLTVADHHALAQAIQRAGIPGTAAVIVRQEEEEEESWDVQISWEGEFYTPAALPRPDGLHPPFRPAPWTITSQVR